MQYGKFIEVTGNNSKQLRFLARAVFNMEKDSDLRPYKAALKYIYFEETEKEGELIGAASNGHHLHVTVLSSDFVKNTGLSAGYWRVLKSKDRKQIIWLINIDKPGSDIIFPDFKKAIPTGEAKYKTTFESSDSIALAKFLHGFPDVTAINVKYLYTLDDGSWEVFWYESEKAIKLVQGDLISVIMPLAIIQEENNAG
jgi:hypothetical protein